MKSFSLSEIQEKIRAGQLTHERLVLHYLDQLEKHQDHNAFVEVFAEEVLAAAKNLDSKFKSEPSEMGPLFGAVISIKDNLCYKDHITSAGSKMLTSFTSPYSSTAVERILEADGLIIGRTNCDEFSMGSSSESSYYGPICNAKDKNRVAGGSSGGAAVSVALDMCLIGIGSDTGGSVRQPACFNGLIGYKPSYGLVSRWGLIAYASSFDQVGIIANDVKCIDACMDVISGPDDKDGSMYSEDVFQNNLEKKGLEQLKIGVLSDWINKTSLKDNIVKSTNAYISALSEKGLKIDPISFPFTEYLVPCYYILTLAEASSNLSRYDGLRYGHRTEKDTDDYKELMALNRSEGFGEAVKRRIITGAFLLSETYSEEYFVKAARLRRKIKAYTDDLLEKYDLIICPITTSEAFLLGSRHENPVENYFSDVFTVLANLTGIPSISLPIRNNDGDLPLGIQLLTKQFDDKNLLFLTNELTNLA